MGHDLDASFLWYLLWFSYGKDWRSRNLTKFFDFKHQYRQNSKGALSGLRQGSSIDLKSVYVTTYVLKNLGIHHVQGENYKELKNTKTVRVRQKQRIKNLFDVRFFLNCINSKP